MKRLATALTVLVGVLGLAASQAAANGVAFGVNDNAGLYEAGTGPFWDTMTGLGLTTNTITLRFDETIPGGLNPTDQMISRRPSPPRPRRARPWSSMSIRGMRRSSPIHAGRHGSPRC